MSWYGNAGTTYYIYISGTIIDLPNRYFSLALNCECTQPSFGLSMDHATCPTSVDLIVDVTDLGNTNSVDITNDINGSAYLNVGIGTYVLTGFTHGDTVTVNVKSNHLSSCQLTRSFNIPAVCPPDYDDCLYALPLTINPDLSCTILNPATNEYSTPSSQSDDVTGYPDNDVWFSFVATGSSHKIELLNIVPVVGHITNTNMGMGLYDGSGGCSALTLHTTSDPESFTATGLTIGTIYYLRVYGWYPFSSIYYAECTFDVCIGSFPQPPINDDCSIATVVTCGSSFISQTTDLANDTGASNLGCATLGVGVWYKFVPTDSKTGIVTVTPTTSWNPELVVVSSTDCSTYTNIACANNGASGNPETITFEYFAGQIYYFYVGDFGIGSTNTGDFDLDFSCDCPSEYTLANGNRLVGAEAGPKDYETNGIIESDQLVTGTSGNVDYDSGTEIHLLEGFETVIGALFHAFIDGCEGSSIKDEEEDNDKEK